MASPLSHPLGLPNEVKRLHLGSINYYENELYISILYICIAVKVKLFSLH